MRRTPPVADTQLRSRAPRIEKAKTITVVLQASCTNTHHTPQRTGNKRPKKGVSIKPPLFYESPTPHESIYHHRVRHPRSLALGQRHTAFRFSPARLAIARRAARLGREGREERARVPH
eukprot:1783249-Prymnesium_polylepis.1